MAEVLTMDRAATMTLEERRRRRREERRRERDYHRSLMENAEIEHAAYAPPGVMDIAGIRPRRALLALGQRLLEREAALEAARPDLARALERAAAALGRAMKVMDRLDPLPEHRLACSDEERAQRAAAAAEGVTHAAG